MTTRRTLLTGLVGLGALATAGCSGTGGSATGPTRVVAGAPQPTPSSDPVAVRAVLTAPLTVGLVVSLSSPAGEGSEWALAAEGAQVATHRLQRGGATVDLVAVNDRGTAQGIVEAVEKLASHAVAAVVVATTGSHVRAALEPAARHGLPLVLAHPVPGSLLRDGVWCTAPVTEQVDARLVALAGRGASLVDAGGGTPGGLLASHTFRVGAGGPDASTLARLGNPASTVVATGGAESLAATVAALQARSHTGRVVLGPSALSPGFVTALDRAGASLGSDLLCGGLPTGDPTALTPGDQGVAVTNFLAAVRDAAVAGPTSLFDHQPFSTVAWAAGAASHDAVVAVACAAALAASSDPRRVAQHLAGLRLGHADGIVAPSLDLTRTGAGPVGRAAVASSQVVALRSTDEDPGLRPADPSGDAGLFWFADS